MLSQLLAHRQQKLVDPSDQGPEGLIAVVRQVTEEEVRDGHRHRVAADGIADAAHEESEAQKQGHQDRDQHGPNPGRFKKQVRPTGNHRNNLVVSDVWTKKNYKI